MEEKPNTAEPKRLRPSPISLWRRIGSTVLFIISAVFCYRSSLGTIWLVFVRDKSARGVILQWIAAIGCFAAGVAIRRMTLRSLLIVVALLAAACGYVAHEANLLQQRKIALNQVKNLGGDYTSEEMLVDKRTVTGVSWIRRLLQDSPIESLSLPPETNVESRRRLASLFPEAKITAHYQYDEYHGTKCFIRVTFNEPDPEHPEPD